jgi:hypothetical protein
MIERDLTQQEWDLLRTIRIYRQIRNSKDEELKDRVRREAEDALLALIPTDDMKAWIAEKRAARTS